MRFLSVLSVACAVRATRLYVTSYSSTITTLSLTQHESGFELSTIDTHRHPPDGPDFLQLDEQNGVLYCIDRNGYLSSYKTLRNGSLTQIDRQATFGEPVHHIFYNLGKSLGVAHYEGSGVSSWEISPDGHFCNMQNITFDLTDRGPNVDRQDAPHPHEVIVDPTGSYIVVPDLGSDKLRVFFVETPSGKLVERPAFSTPPGTGPRHGAFRVEGGVTFLYTVSELSDLVTSYIVHYGDDTLNFTEISVKNIYNIPAPAGSLAAEAVITPDRRFLLTSSRFDNFFQITNFDPYNSTKISSDTLQVWAIDGSTGKPALKQLAPAGGEVPRQFSLNKAGTLAAVALQNSARVVVVERDPSTGVYGEFVAEIDVPDQPNCVIWDERNHEDYED